MWCIIIFWAKWEWKQNIKTISQQLSQNTTTSFIEIIPSDWPTDGGQIATSSSHCLYSSSSLSIAKFVPFTKPYRTKNLSKNLNLSITAMFFVHITNPRIMWAITSQIVCGLYHHWYEDKLLSCSSPASICHLHSGNIEDICSSNRLDSQPQFSAASLTPIDRWAGHDRRGAGRLPCRCLPHWVRRWIQCFPICSKSFSV